MELTGNRDICYFNEACFDATHLLGMNTSRQNLSNAFYVVCGLTLLTSLFLLRVCLRKVSCSELL